MVTVLPILVGDRVSNSVQTPGTATSEVITAYSHAVSSVTKKDISTITTASRVIVIDSDFVVLSDKNNQSRSLWVVEQS